eukprot:GHRR01029253.1.p1 GENE.GHRR01029253.1~~GHRR01029253.1.p1  ORF type:complete len:114 (+),score=11.74 GHRR01029253.1:584-925(+)
MSFALLLFLPRLRSKFTLLLPLNQSVVPGPFGNFEVRRDVFSDKASFCVSVRKYSYATGIRMTNAVKIMDAISGMCHLLPEPRIRITPANSHTCILGVSTHWSAQGQLDICSL